MVVVEGLDQPTSAVEDHRGRLLVTEKAGAIRVFEDGGESVDPLLQLDTVVSGHRVEQGLLSVALHPRFETNGLIYVDLTDRDGDVRIIEYSVVDTEDGPVADPETARLVMEVEQPGQFHNGGMLQFGPDGYLYASFGDGHFGESSANARDTRTLLGSIVRIDVDGAEPYAVPDDNPFVDSDGSSAPEIWAYGVRNPWRFFIDPVDRVVVVADVGQFEWEEVSVLPLDSGGHDLGWPIMEGDTCYLSDPCDRTGMVIPDLIYSHEVGCAIIGGPVYRGSLIPALRGMVVYADFCAGFVRAFGVVGHHVVRHVDLVDAGRHGPIQSLAVDGDGEILILTQEGEIRRLQPAG